MDWQKVLLYDMMAVDDDGLWVHSKFGLSVRAGTAKAKSTRCGSCGGCSMASTSCTPRTARRSTARGFLPTSPLAGDDARATGGKVLWKNFYPRPPCGGRPDAMQHIDGGETISIHVPLRGTTCAGVGCSSKSCEFLSTSPLRGRPLEGRIHTDRHTNFYPRPPCGGRHRLLTIQLTLSAFLSTSPLRGTTSASGIPPA